MKRFLLFATVLLATQAIRADVVTDGQSYTTTSDLNCENVWIIDRFHNSSAFSETTVFGSSYYSSCRTATMKGDTVYVANRYSGTCIYRYSALTGDYIDYLTVTLNGSALASGYNANTIGFDSFGNLYIAAMRVSGTSETIYVVDTSTGAVSSTISLTSAVSERIDYVDVIGDITGTQADCTIMAAGSSTSYVFAWYLEKGGTSWSYGLDGTTGYLTISTYYPTGASNWGSGAAVKILEGTGDNQYTGEYFCVDGQATYPTIYNKSGEVVTDFSSTTAKAYIPANAYVNGFCKFTLDGRTFVAYPMGDNNASSAVNQHTVNICELGTDNDFSTMTYYWTIPADGLGATSDNGLRIECIVCDYATANDTQYVNLFIYKCYNGMGVYRIYPTTLTGVEGTFAEADAELVSEKFYTIGGTQVAEPTQGGKSLYIVVKTYSDGSTKAVKEIR